MKRLFFITACAAVLFSSCGKQQESKPFDVRDIDSVTVKDGNKNEVRLSIKFLLDSTTNDLFQSEEELNQFFEGIVWNLQTECSNPRSFVPEKIWNVEFVDTIEYKGEKMFVIKSLVDGVAKNGFGVEGKVSDILNLIAWREITHFEAEGDEQAEDWAFWHVMANDKFYLDKIKENIDKRHSK